MTVKHTLLTTLLKVLPLLLQTHLSHHSWHFLKQFWKASSVSVFGSVRKNMASVAAEYCPMEEQAGKKCVPSHLFTRSGTLWLLALLSLRNSHER